jgi:hypothetical protein
MNNELNIHRNSTARRSSSLYHRILTVLAVIFVLMAAVIAAGIQVFVIKNENIFWHERQTEAVHNAASQVAGYIEKNESILSHLSRFDFDKMQTHPDALQNFLLENPAFLEIAFFDSNGNTLLSAADKEPILANQFTVRQSQWFRSARLGKSNYSRVQTSPSGESYLIYATPFQENGVLVAQIKMDGLWQKVAGITFGKLLFPCSNLAKRRILSYLCHTIPREWRPSCPD